MGAKKHSPLIQTSKAGAEGQIRDIEEELQRTQYNKATQGHIGRLKAKLAKLKEESGKGGGGAGLGYAIKKSGDATVILAGFPSVGKSTLLNRLTNADSRVAEYDFTTLTVIPGVLEFRGAKIQVLDVPGIIEEAASGKGRGREVLSVIRSADLLLVVVAGSAQDRERQKTVIQQELSEAGFRLNQKKPDITIVRKSEGGLRIGQTKKSRLSPETVKGILKEFRIHNAEVMICDDASVDQFIDCLSRNRIYLPAVFVANKMDLYPDHDAGSGFLSISALREAGIGQLKEEIWSALELKRVYLKKPGKPPDLQEPLILRGACRVSDVCKRLSLLTGFRYAKIWGPSSRFPGQKVGAEHQLRDEDVVEVHH